AKAAVFAAAFHDGYEGGGAVDAGRGKGVELLDFRKADVDLRAAFAAAAGNELGQAVQGLGAEDHVDVGRAGDDGGAFLAGYAAADAYDQARLAFLELAGP